MYRNINVSVLLIALLVVGCASVNVASQELLLKQPEIEMVTPETQLVKIENTMISEIPEGKYWQKCGPYLLFAKSYPGFIDEVILFIFENPENRELLTFNFVSRKDILIKRNDKEPVPTVQAVATKKNITFVLSINSADLQNSPCLSDKWNL